MNPYEQKSASDLRWYLGQRGLGIRPTDVERYLGRRVPVSKLNKQDLVKLHMKLDQVHRGLNLS